MSKHPGEGRGGTNGPSAERGDAVAIDPNVRRWQV